MPRPNGNHSRPPFYHLPSPPQSTPVSCMRWPPSPPAVVRATWPPPPTTPPTRAGQLASRPPLSKPPPPHYLVGTPIPPGPLIIPSHPFPAFLRALLSGLFIHPSTHPSMPSLHPSTPSTLPPPLVSQPMALCMIAPHPARSQRARPTRAPWRGSPAHGLITFAFAFISISGRLHCSCRTMAAWVGALPPPHTILARCHSLAFAVPSKRAFVINFTCVRCAGHFQG